MRDSDNDKRSFTFLSNTRNTLTVALTAAIWLLASCGGGSSPSSPAPPSATLSYPTPQVFNVGIAIGSVAPKVSGTITSYSVSPGLPTGLQLDSSTGVISGTPVSMSPTINYSVSGTTPGGAVTASISITVNDRPPAVAYASDAFGFTVGIPAVKQNPIVTGGYVTSWTIDPPLPGGFSFDGSFWGTPTAVSPATVYTVTARNSGGTTTAKLKIAVESTVLLELGHAHDLVQLRSSPTRLLSADSSTHWVLWNSATAANAANGDSTCYTVGCQACNTGLGCPGVYPQVDLAGPTVVIETANGLQIRSSTDGHVLSTVTGPDSWWKLSTDGGYVCAGGTSGLSVWSSADGHLVLSRNGDYSKAVAFAAPTEIRVALGPAGDAVIEAIAVPTGVDTVSPAFLGKFNSWFVDGERFLTNLTTTVWTYSKTAVQQDVTTVTSTENLTGQGNWFWIWTRYGVLTIYKVGASTSPTATYSTVNPVAVPSGTSIGLLGAPQGSPQLSVVDLSGATPSKTDYAIPVGSPIVFSAVSSSNWYVGSEYGVLLDGATLSGPLKYFGYGSVLSIVGSPQRVVVATAIGKILYFDPGTAQLQGTIDLYSPDLALSDDGTILAAVNGDPIQSDRSIKLFSLPSGVAIKTWPYTSQTYPFPAIDLAFPSITLSGSGTVFGRVLFNGGSTYDRIVTAEPAGTAIWSATSQLNAMDGQADPIRLSPDGTHIAAAQGPGPDLGVAGTASLIVNNGVLAGATPGWAVGWLDDNHLLLDTVEQSGSGTIVPGCSIVDATGNPLGCPALPIIDGLQRVTPDSFYATNLNSIYSVTSTTTAAGMAWTSQTLWTGADAFGGGAVAGARVAYVAGAQVVEQTY